MKKISYFLFICIFILTGCKKDNPGPDIVDIPDLHFFTALLLDNGVNTDGDRFISYAEAEATTGLDVNNKEITSMKGIEAFVNLETLICSHNQLIALYVSKNTALRTLDCSENQLIHLNVLNNTALEHLECGGNQLPELDLSKNTALNELDCSGNYFWIHPSFDLSNNIALEYLICRGNSIPSLDISNCTQLKYLDCSRNNLTKLDIQNNARLTDPDYVWFPTAGLYINDNPSLYEVCVWTTPFPPGHLTVETTGSPNVSFTTDCSK